jgi:hypothetical protein
MRFTDLLFAGLMWTIAACSAASAQSFSMKDYLAGAREARALEGFKAKLDFLGKHNFNSPWLREMQVRVRTNDLNFSPDDYRLRLSPTNPAEISANKRYYKAQVEQLEAEYRSAFAEVLKDRYALVVNHFLLDLQRQYEENALNTAGDIARLTTQLADERRIRLDDLLDLDAWRFETEVDQGETIHRIREIERMMAEEYAFAGGIDWSSTRLIDPGRMQEILRDNSAADPGRNVYVASEEMDYKLREARLSVERSESWRNMGYLQAEYDRNTFPDIQQDLGFQLGLRIPITNPDRADLARDRYRLLDIPYEINAKADRYRLESNLLHERFGHYYNLYQKVEMKIEEVKKLDIWQLAQTETELDLGGLVTYREYLLDLERKRTNLLNDLYEIYIDFLDVQGRLVEMPLVNYLSPSLDEL